MKPSVILYTLVASLLILSACKEKSSQAEPPSISVRIKADPSFLNPLKSMGTKETEINQYLFLPLANYHPASLQLIPVLIDSIPLGIIHSDGPHAGQIEFKCHLRDDANWDDGKPITASDYLFTIKAIKYEKLQVVPSLSSIFGEMLEVEIDPGNPKSFSAYLNKDFILAKELALIMELLPEHLYDPDFTLRNYRLTKGELESVVVLDSILAEKTDRFISAFNHADNGRTRIYGSGPYQMGDWQTKQRITLVRKDGWWGDAHPDNPYLTQYPERIFFDVYPDDQTALTALQNGSLDVIGNLDGYNFQRLKKDERLSDRLLFYSVPQLSYYFIGINNQDKLLKDKNLRKALARLLDLDAFIQNQENGLGVRLQSPIIPSRSYYNDTLAEIAYDPEGALQLLKASGWQDSDQNGVLDKILDGKKVDCELEILIAGKPLGKNLALTLKERASQIGVKIDIVTQDARIIRGEIASRDFGLYPTGVNYGLYPEDLYQSWHSDNDYPGGSNKYGFNHPVADSIIELIRETSDSTRLDHLYREVQAVIYEEQPCIFLYAPTNNIIVNKRLKPMITVKNPGYFLNGFQIGSSER